MPGGDGTGPAGFGPMTGRAAGYCVGYPVPGYMNPIPGRGYWGRGRGGGRGYRNWYYATGLPGWARVGMGYPAWRTVPAAGYPPPYASYGAPYYGVPLTHEQEIDTLKGQAEYFEDALDGIKKRIEELEKKKRES